MFTAWGMNGIEMYRRFEEELYHKLSKSNPKRCRRCGLIPGLAVQKGLHCIYGESRRPFDETGQNFIQSREDYLAMVKNEFAGVNQENEMLPFESRLLRQIAKQQLKETIDIGKLTIYEASVILACLQFQRCEDTEPIIKRLDDALKALQTP